MGSRWEPPPNPSTEPGEDDGWINPPVAGSGEVVRVVLHGASEAVWLDPVFGKKAPRIHLLTAGWVARSRLLAWWCRLFGHRPLEVRVLEGSPVQARAGAESNAMTVTVEQSDGHLQAYALEPTTRSACRVCRTVLRPEAEQKGLARLRPTWEPAPTRGRSGRWRALAPRKLRGPAEGIYASAVTPFAIESIFLLLGLPLLLGDGVVPGWLFLLAGGAVVADIAISTIAGHVRRFLEGCGARFGQPGPLGRKPGGAALWSAAPALDRELGASRLPG